MLITDGLQNNNKGNQPWKWLSELSRHSEWPLVNRSSFLKGDRTKFDGLFWPAGARTPLLKSFLQKLRVPIVLYFPGPYWNSRDVYNMFINGCMEEVLVGLQWMLMPRRLWQHLLCSDWIRGVVALSHWTANWLTKLGCPPEKLIVLRMGVDKDFWTTSNVASQENTKLCYVGAATKQRGVVDLIRAFSVAAEKNQSLRLEILARIDSCNKGRRIVAPELSRINEERISIVRENLSKEELKERISKSCALVAPFVAVRAEQPLSLFESICLGVPVITTATGGLEEMVEQGGLTVPAGHVSALSDAMLHVADNHNRSRLARRAHEKAAKIPTWYEACSSWIELLQKRFS